MDITCIYITFIVILQFHNLAKYHNFIKFNRYAISMSEIKKKGRPKKYLMKMNTKVYFISNLETVIRCMTWRF